MLALIKFQHDTKSYFSSHITMFPSLFFGSWLSSLSAFAFFLVSELSSWSERPLSGIFLFKLTLDSGFIKVLWRVSSFWSCPLSLLRAMMMWWWCDNESASSCVCFKKRERECVIFVIAHHLKNENAFLEVVWDQHLWLWKFSKQKKQQPTTKKNPNTPQIPNNPWS